MYSVTIAADGSSRRAKLRSPGAEIWAASTIVNEIYMIFRDGLLCHLPIHPYDGFKEQYQKTGRQTGHGTASKSPLVFSRTDHHPDVGFACQPRACDTDPISTPPIYFQQPYIHRQARVPLDSRNSICIQSNSAPMGPIEGQNIDLHEQQ